MTIGRPHTLPPSETRGLAQGSLALQVFGTGSTLWSLAALLPQGGVGCSLLATPDFSMLAIPRDGRLITTLAIPNLTSALGLTLTHQVLGIETAAGAISSLTASNGLQLRIGRF